MIPRTRRAWADGDTDVCREQEQDARAVEEATPDPDAMDLAFGDVTQMYTDSEICELARRYYLEYGWPSQGGDPCRPTT